MTDSLETKVADALVERALAAFDGGLVNVPDPANARGYTTHYRPKEAMRAAIATMLAEMRHPTQAMLNAGADECGYREDAHINAACCWTAMLSTFGGGK